MTVARVWHGPWVEARKDWFVEGAWDGDFEKGDFDKAPCMAGSGGIARPEGFVFAGPGNMMERIQSLRDGNRLWISNSIPFLLTAVGDEPDPAYRFYYDDLTDYRSAGTVLKRKPLPTGGGREILLHDCCNLAIRPDLSIRRVEKPLPPEPHDYASYVAMLSRGIERTLRNARDPARERRRYTPLVTVSKGYDATGIAALASSLGASEAVTFCDRGAKSPWKNDSGRAIGGRLGLQVTEYGTTDFQAIPGTPEAEFFACPNGMDVVMAAVEAQVEGRIFLTGRHGDDVLSRVPSSATAHLAKPRDSQPDGHFVSASNCVPGMTMNEFRLRVGFIQFPPYYLGGQHAWAITRISQSKAMQPWSVGGEYDRPIARRIIEEAGIPRDSFGQRKTKSAGKFEIFHVEDMSPGGRDDFSDFVRRLPAMSLKERMAFTLRMGLNRFRLKRAYSRRWRHHLTRRTDLDFAIHWGFARIRSRYSIPQAGVD